MMKNMHRKLPQKGRKAKEEKRIRSGDNFEDEEEEKVRLQNWQSLFCQLSIQN